MSKTVISIIAVIGECGMAAVQYAGSTHAALVLPVPGQGLNNAVHSHLHDHYPHTGGHCGDHLVGAA